MKSSKGLAVAALAVALGAFALPAQAVTVTIPDLNPGGYVFYGNGDVSVTYSGVTFTQSAALSNGNLYNVGSNYYIGPEATLSSQQQTVGVANILISLPVFTKSFSVDYGTFDGSDVTFLLSTGANITQTSVGGEGYTMTNVFDVGSGSPFNSVLITSPDYVLAINNITYGRVPEPATWAMMLVGFGGLAFAMRSRRKEAVATA
jgi:hypothetical protein